MRKLICLALGTALCLGAAAQTWQDALLFSENNYLGTARSVGMGNALTAVGGDPGSLTFNPAGSAVAGYSQFVITPAYTLTVANVKGSPYMDYPLMADAVNTKYGRLSVPNFGFIFTHDTGRRHGIKRVSYGLVVNASNNYTDRFNAAGVNDDNSYAASLASSADGFAAPVLANEDWYYSGDASRMPAWVDMTGYRAGLYNGVTDRPGAYIAVTEIMDANGNFRLAAPLYQQYGQQAYGSKKETVLNYAINISDKFYLGANLGFTSLRYRMNEYWFERPDNDDDFPMVQYSDGSSAQFESLRMKRNFELDGVGIYLKLGALWRPVAGLRLGAAIQTPTMMDLTERYGYTAELNMKGRYYGPASSPEDEWIYALRTPFRFNAGVAYTVGALGMVSADYEYCNYSQAGFRSRSEYDGYAAGPFSDVNADIADIMGVSHQLRVGLECRPTQAFSLRAGYNLTTSAQLNTLDASFNPHPLSADDLKALAKHSVSVGAGYSFGSLYLDAALRARFVPEEYVIPYSYYYAPNSSQYYYKDVDDGILTPEVVVKRSAFDALVTLGWRF